MKAPPLPGKEMTAGWNIREGKLAGFRLRFAELRPEGFDPCPECVFPAERRRAPGAAHTRAPAGIVDLPMQAHFFIAEALFESLQAVAQCRC